jgi:hypothetical protein
MLRTRPYQVYATLQTEFRTSVGIFAGIHVVIFIGILVGLDIRQLTGISCIVPSASWIRRHCEDGAVNVVQLLAQN